jgi:hypothetical protein
MGLLDDAIREHLELKRRHGADPSEVARQEREALGSPRSPAAAPAAPDDGPAGDETMVAAPAPPPPEPEAGAEPEAPAGEAGHHGAVSLDRFGPEPDLDWSEPAPPRDAEPEAQAEPDGDGEDVLEETPEFLQETPEHDRLWFEQRPPRDFDF